MNTSIQVTPSGKLARHQLEIGKQIETADGELLSLIYLGEMGYPSGKRAVLVQASNGRTFSANLYNLLSGRNRSLRVR